MIRCDYCGQKNQPEREECRACGAPLPDFPPIPSVSMNCCDTGSAEGDARLQAAYQALLKYRDAEIRGFSPPTPMAIVELPPGWNFETWRVNR
jgi:hypothetical protein